MINIKQYLSVLSVILISGYADPNDPLSPPKENQWITVEGVAPKLPFNGGGRCKWKIIFKPKLDETKIPKITVTKKRNGLNILTGELTFTAKR